LLDKEYLAGASGSKTCDKEDSAATLGDSPQRGVKHAPSDSNSVASNHSGVCPAARHRHWNFGFCERREYGSKVSPSRVTGTERARDIFPDGVFWVFSIGCLPHFINNSYGFVKEAAALADHACPAARRTQVLAGRTEGDYLHRRERGAVELCDVADVRHFGKVAHGYGHRLRQYLAGPQRLYPEKSTGIGEAPYAVKQTAKRQISCVQGYMTSS
jgi:hypothetical protein